MQSIRRDCYMMGWPRTSRVFLKWKSGGFLSSLISIGCICVLCCMAVFSCAISWPSFGCKQPYSSATHQAPSPFWRSHIALPRLKPSFVHANCDPSSLPLHDDRRASGPESRHGEAVKSDLPARPSAVGKREKKEPTTYFGVVPLFLFSQLDAAQPNSSAWRRESSVRYCSVLELGRALCFLTQLCRQVTSSIILTLFSKDRQKETILSPPHSILCISVAQT